MDHDGSWHIFHTVRRIARIREVTLAVLLFSITASCAPSGLTGVVQTSQMVQGGYGYELTLGTSQDADYIFVEMNVLLDLQGMLAAQQNSRNLLLLGDRFVGRRIKVSGTIERDSLGRKFIRVSNRAQIELL